MWWKRELVARPPLIGMKMRVLSGCPDIVIIPIRRNIRERLPITPLLSR
jgi:hypothetical protein